MYKTFGPKACNLATCKQAECPHVTQIAIDKIIGFFHTSIEHISITKLICYIRHSVTSTSKDSMAVRSLE